MRDKLTRYRDVLEDSIQFEDSARNALDEERRVALRRMEPTVKEIVRTLDNSLAEFSFDLMGGNSTLGARSTEAPGLSPITMSERSTSRRTVIRADSLHPWMWDASRTFWESRHYRAAVQTAASAINDQCQNNVGPRDVADNDLMNQVFTERPKAGQAFLRLPGDESDQTIASRNRALRPYAEGCFAGIRNPSTHQ